MIDEPLEPPGTIAVIGAGPIGLEAALYGRFLGYDVTVFEAGRIAERWRSSGDQEVPFLPGRGLSPLATSAVQTHRDGAAPLPRVLPMTTAEWIEESLEVLAASDLLAGRVQTQCRVSAVSLAAVPADDQSADDEPTGDEGSDQVPADFVLEVARDDGGHQMVRVEAVIDTTGGPPGDADFSFAVPHTDAFQRRGAAAEDGDFRTAVAYFYRVNAADASAPQGLSLETGWDRIRRLYAMLGERQSLDLYRPLRQ